MDTKKPNNRTKTTVAVIASCSILLLVLALSYAWLPTDNLPNEPEDATASTATLKLRYNDCASDRQEDCAEISADLAPGDSVTKTFEIKNVGTMDVNYDIFFRELSNTFTKDELVYTLENLTTGNTEASNVPVPFGERTNSLIKRKFTSKVGSTTKFRLTITFLNTAYDQAENSEAEFSLKLSIKETEIEPSEVTLAKLNVSANVNNPDFTKTATTDEGIFSMEDDYGVSYYYRGAVTNNYVKFADKFWRIIRVNGDGSLRVIYDGTTAHANGEESEDRFVGASKWKDNYDDTKYVGYMFGGTNGEASTSKEQAQTNTTDSTMKTYLDTWYQENILATGNAKYVSDTLFCNDRSTVSTPSSYGTMIGDTGLGYAKNVTVFGYWNRITLDETPQVTGASPTLKCSQKNDAFTVQDKSLGNGSLTYPIGLMTSDEASIAGGVAMISNSDYYLFKGFYYWMFSPALFYGDNTNVSIVSGGGALDIGGVSGAGAVAPVINLSSEFIENMTGDGSMTNPYTLKS